MRDILRIAAPFTLWIVAFSAIYGLEGLVCSRHGAHLDAATGRLMLLAAWGVAIAAHLLLAHAYRGPMGGDTRFHRFVALTLALAALAATVWTLMPVATMSMCL